MSIFSNSGPIYDPATGKRLLDPRTGPIASQRAVQQTPFIMSLGETENELASRVDRSKARASEVTGLPYLRNLGVAPEPWIPSEKPRVSAMEQLRERISELPSLTNQDLRIQARKQLTPIFRPQIRSTKKSIRQTERQGRVAARQVQGYYNQAGAKVAGMAKGGRKAQKQAINKINTGGVRGDSAAGAERNITAKSLGRMGKANAAFFKQLQGALAGEGAVAAADTRSNYKNLANEYRADLADLRSERAAAIQKLVQQRRQNINKTARSVYEDSYLKGIKQGMTPRQAQRAALALAGTYNPTIEAKAAQMILKNKGDEKLLAQMQGGNQLTWDQKMDKRDNAREDFIAYMTAAEKASTAGNQELADKYMQMALQLSGG